MLTLSNSLQPPCLGDRVSLHGNIVSMNIISIRTKQHRAPVVVGWWSSKTLSSTSCVCKFETRVTRWLQAHVKQYRILPMVNRNNKKTGVHLQANSEQTETTSKPRASAIHTSLSDQENRCMRTSKRNKFNKSVNMHHKTYVCRYLVADQ